MALASLGSLLLQRLHLEEKMLNIRHLIVGSVFFGCATSALALPTAAAAWVQPTGNTTPTAVVPVFVRLTVATGSLNLDNLATNFTTPDLAGFSSITSISKSASADCGTTFWPQAPLASCFDPASPWKWQFDYSASSFLTATGTLGSGQSRDFLLGSFTPQNGPVAAGTYSFSGAALTLYVQGLDAMGTSISQTFTLGSTCASYSASCAFTRTVISAVPEPATYLLMMLGSVSLLSLAHRRRS